MTVEDHGLLLEVKTLLVERSHDLLQLHKDVAEMRVMLDNVRHAVEGNGQRPMSERVAANTRDVELLLEHNERAEQNGHRYFMLVLGTVATALLSLISTLLSWVLK